MDRWLNKIHCGDCLEVMREMPDKCVDAIVTDPPFAFAGGISNGSSSQASDQFFAYWWKDVCVQLNRILKPEGSGFIWCDWQTARIFSDGFKSKVQTYGNWRVAQMIYHYREMPGQGQPFRSSVDMVAYVRGPKHKDPPIKNTQHNFISEYWYYGKHKWHTAEKSPSMVRRFIEWCSKPGEIILDPFAGSGVVSCEATRLDRQWIAIEKDAEYCELIERRRLEEFSQLNMFHPRVEARR